MKSLRRLALALSLVASTGHAAAVDHPLHTDVYRELLRFRTSVQAKSIGEAVWGTPGMLTKLLVDPASPYSDLVEAPSFTNETWWPRFAHTVARDSNDPLSAALATLRWQTGLTKARPGIDLEVSPLDEKLFRGKEVAASAIKAGISADIFTMARFRHPSKATFAAREAVALQLLREQMATVPKERWASLAIREDVFRRYMSNTPHYPSLGADRTYLLSILHAAVRSGSMSMSSDGIQQLPAALRVARAAAAFKDAIGYFGGPYCINNSPAPGRATDASAFERNSPLCFVAATDRGVHRWYRHEARLDASAQSIHENTHDGWNVLAHWVNGFMALIEVATFAEFVESLAAEAMEAEVGIPGPPGTAQRSVSELMCGIRRP